MIDLKGIIQTKNEQLREGFILAGIEGVMANVQIQLPKDDNGVSIVLTYPLLIGSRPLTTPLPVSGGPEGDHHPHRSQ